MAEGDGEGGGLLNRSVSQIGSCGEKVHICFAPL